jgi:hypothetical protein
MALPVLPTSFGATRESLRMLACYVVSPARKARTGRIGLRSTGAGFGTPPFDDGSRILVEADRLVRDPGDSITITTLRATAAFLGVELSPDPGVGHDLPPYKPEDVLDVDAESSLALGAWYAFGQRVLDQVRTEDAQLWPEHFDLAVTVELDRGHKVNLGFSPGDSFSDDPYAYVGPHDLDGLSGTYWNAPFGAYLPYGVLAATDDPDRAALAFVRQGLAALA